MMKNTGTLIANDFNKSRLPPLVGNCARLGVRNVVVANYDGRKLAQHFSKMDRVLLDAPCSGLGVIARDPSIKTVRTQKDIERCSHLQKELSGLPHFFFFPLLFVFLTSVCGGTQFRRHP